MANMILALITIVVLTAAAWVLHRFFKKRGIRIPTKIVLIFAAFYGVAALFLYSSIRGAQTVRTAALADIHGKATQASALVQRLLTDSSGTAVATESGTYLALGGEQILLPTPIATALQKELTVQNLRLP